MWGVVRGVAAVVAVVLVAGCGGGTSGGSGDPARLVPAGAPFYLEVVVRPEGAVREDALAAAAKVLRTDDPSGRVRALVQREFAARGEDVVYERDLEPWLGSRAAIWSVPSERAVVLLAAARDTDAALESLRAMLDRGGHQVAERSHRDREYLLASGVAAGIVEDFVVVGPEELYRRTVDAVEGESLAEADAYAEAVDSLPDDRLASFWADTAALLEVAMREDPVLGRLGTVVQAGGVGPVAGALQANGERLALEARIDVGVRGTPLVAEVPGDSWLAAGASDLGATLRDGLDRFAGPLAGVAIRGELRRELGLDLDRDLLDWMGDAAVFVRGTTPATVEGGIVVQPSDEGAAADAFGRIVGAVQEQRGVVARPVEVAGADQAFVIDDPERGRPTLLARGSGLVVATSSVAAAEAALGSDDRLGDGELYAEAERLVAMEPSLLVSVPDLLAFADRETRRRLEPFSVLAAGGGEGAARVAAALP